MHARLEEAEREIREHESHRQERQQEAMTGEGGVGPGGGTPRCAARRHEQIEKDLHQRRQEREQTDRQQAASRARQQENQRTLLEASSALAVWYLRKEAAERQLPNGATSVFGSIGSDNNATNRLRPAAIPGVPSRSRPTPAN